MRVKAPNQTFYRTRDGKDWRITRRGSIGPAASQSNLIGPRDEYPSAATHEIVMAARDLDLGRWRWPENFDYVVYPDVPNTPRGSFRVWNERVGVSRFYLNESGVDGLGEDFDLAAQAYLDAHPEPQPKPWHDARPNELWRLTIEGKNEDAFAHQLFPHPGVSFTMNNRPPFSVLAPEIEGGIRLFPPLEALP